MVNVLESSWISVQSDVEISKDNRHFSWFACT